MRIHNILQLFVRMHFVYTNCFNFIIAYPYFLDIRVEFIYIGCTGNYVRIVYTCFNLIIAYLHLIDARVYVRVGKNLYTGCTGNYMCGSQYFTIIRYYNRISLLP